MQKRIEWLNLLKIFCLFVFVDTNLPWALEELGWLQLNYFFLPVNSSSECRESVLSNTAGTAVLWSNVAVEV